MPNWMRIGLGLLAGVFAGGLSIAGVETLGHSVTEGDGLFAVAASGLGIAGFVGGSVSAWISKVSKLPWVIAIVLGALSLVNVFTFEHPIWFVPVAFILLGLGTGIASQLHKSKTSAL